MTTPARPSTPSLCTPHTDRDSLRDVAHQAIREAQALLLFCDADQAAEWEDAKERGIELTGSDRHPWRGATTTYTERARWSSARNLACVLVQYADIPDYGTQRKNLLALLDNGPAEVADAIGEVNEDLWPKFAWTILRLAAQAVGHLEDADRVPPEERWRSELTRRVDALLATTGYVAGGMTVSPEANLESAREDLASSGRVGFAVYENEPAELAAVGVSG